jgi:hypothetical protein
MATKKRKGRKKNAEAAAQKWLLFFVSFAFFRGHYSSLAPA